MAGLPALTDILEEYQLVDADDRYRLLIDLGRQLEPMPEALKTDSTKVRGCSASVWVYPTATDGRLHFLADSNAAITKGIVALVLTAVQDRPAAEVARDGCRRMPRAVRTRQASQRQSDAGRSEHDRARQGNRRALRRPCLTFGREVYRDRGPDSSLNAGSSNVSPSRRSIARRVPASRLALNRFVRIGQRRRPWRR